VEELKGKGLRLVEDLNSLSQDDVVLIRSHGIAPEYYKLLESKGIKFIDATCPIVKGIQMLCKQLSSKGYRILIYGDKEHEEVKSLLGFSGGRAQVIDEEKLEELEVNERTILISQSTKDEASFFKILDKLVELGLPKNNFYNTICSDIKTRQKRVLDLAGRVGVVLILGSRNSANTNNLYKIAKLKCDKSYLISREEELPIEEIKQVEKIGVATGASTPYNFLNLILEKIKNLR
jgi:4-hydroxy-3-methylbut-2-enyl diphosphate reductase